MASAIIQGKDTQGVIAGAVGGAISGAVTGALVSSGVGLIATVGGNFIGGAVGSVTENIISNGGAAGLDAKKVAIDATIDGTISATVSVVASKGINKIVDNSHTKAWINVGKKTTTMNGTWKIAADKAINKDSINAIAKPIVEKVFNTGVDILQDITSPQTLKKEGVACIR